MSHRPLVLVSGLTVGDYLLWNWSLNGNHDVLALVSGLSLPPLAVAWLWLLAVAATRMIGSIGRRSGPLSARRAGGADARPSARGGARNATAAPLDEASTSTGSAAGSSDRLAA